MSQFNVVREIPRYKRGETFVEVTCSKCEEDRELWPDKFLWRKSEFKTRKGIPCGCAKSPRYNETQYEIIVKRLLEGKGEFIGFNKDTINVKQDTRVVYRTFCCGNVQMKTTIANLKKGFRCSSCVGDKISLAKKQDLKLLFDNMVIDNKLAHGSEFIKEVRRGYIRYLQYSCGICSYDEYTLAGVCTGIFRTNATELSNGNRSCRCSAGYKYTDIQMDFRVNKLLMEFNCKLVSINKGSKFTLHTATVLNQQKEYITVNLNTLLCGNYTKTYFEEGKSNFYICEWSYPTGVNLLVKAGMTKRSCLLRIKEQSSVNGFTPLRYIKFESVVYRKCLELECLLRSMFNGYFLTKEEFPDGYTETFKHEYLSPIIEVSKEHFGVNKVEWDHFNYKGQSFLQKTV